MAYRSTQAQREGEEKEMKWYVRLFIELLGLVGFLIIEFVYNQPTFLPHALGGILIVAIAEMFAQRRTLAERKEEIKP